MRTLKIQRSSRSRILCSIIIAFGMGASLHWPIAAADQTAIGSPTTITAATTDAAPASEAAKPPADEALNNDAIIELVKLGLGESVVVDKIKASHCNFDVSLDGLKRLKAAEVPDVVVSAMISATTKEAGRTAPKAGDPNDPKSSHEAGIYFYEEKGGKPKLTKLEPAVYSQQKSGIAIFAQYGQTAQQKAVLHPAHAVLQSGSRKPVFYFYFENTTSGLGETRNIATSPNEFVLAQMDFKEKDKLRTLVIGQVNAYTGTQSGPKDQSIRAFDFEKLAPGIYRVTPKEDLANGEYCLFYGGNSIFGTYSTTSGGKVFDFGVKGPPETEPAAAGKSKKKKSK